MIKNFSYEVRAIKNGFSVTSNWQQFKTIDTSGMDYNYCNETMMFPTWDEVLKYLGDNKPE